MRTHFLITALVLLTGLGLCAAMGQGSVKEISKKEKELARLRSEIEAFEQKLKESEKRERSTLDYLDNLERQVNLIRRFIKKLREQEQQISSDIHEAKSSIGELETQLESLKSHYARYVRSVYKYGRVYDLELLFSSKSINQLSIRIQYLRRFSEQRAKDLQSVVQKKADLEQQNERLQLNLDHERSLLAEKTKEETSLERKASQRQKTLLSIRIQYLRRFSEQRAKDLQSVVQKKADLEQQNERLQLNLDHERSLLAEKTKEETSLERKASQRQKTLLSIRKDQRLYQQELKRKTDAARQIEKLIADLIEKDRLRKEREAAARERLAAEPKRLPEPERETVGSFASLRGRLRWPVSSGTISSRFGNQVHPVLKTVTQNSGVDIAVRSGSDVLAVADGEVSILTFIPGFGNVVILNHYDGFRTLYAHLLDISVVESQKVRSGEAIGKSGESVQGPVLHFEVWKEREKQNPELWLSRAH